jgi:hypothetical protein
MRPLRLTGIEASRTTRRKPVDLASKLAEQLTLAGWRTFVREYHFHPARRWRLDIAFPDVKLGVECEGVGPKGKPGRHQLTQHLHANTEKHSAIAVAGWRLIRVTGRQIQSGHALRWVEAALSGEIGYVFDTPGNWASPRRRRA